MLYLLLLAVIVLVWGLVRLLWPAAPSEGGPGWVTFTCTRCPYVERHRRDDLDGYHAAHAVCPRCGGQQSVSGW